jgi:hypothetical protein
MHLRPDLERRVLELAGATSPPIESSISERDFMAEVIRHARRCGWLVYHTHDSRKSARGFPDLVMVRDRVIFAELKTADGKTTGDQDTWLDSLRTAGAHVYLWRPSDWAEIERTLE